MMIGFLHLYGLIIGLALVCGYGAIMHRAKEINLEQEIQKLIVPVVLFALIGARFYHVITDWSLYDGGSFLQLFAIWHGGLGIYGGVVGGLLAVHLFGQKNLRLKILDIGVLGVTIGQAIGRWGNAVNYELFGLPTSLPWGIVIPSALRPAHFAAFTHFHPLFLYESLAMVVLFLLLWKDTRKDRWLKIGSGKALGLYAVWYGVVRFFLEFLRINPARSGLLTVAQWVSLCAIVLGCSVLFRVRKLIAGLLFIFIALLFVLFGKSKACHQIQIGDARLCVEIVQTPADLEKGLGGRDTIGSDGMLFLLPQRTVATFWMKDMRFGLDFIWIDGEKVVDITEHVPTQPGVPISELKIYSPKFPITKVLELNEGIVEKNGFTIGEIVQ